MRNKDKRSFREELEKTESRKILEEMLESYDSKNLREVFLSIGCVTLYILIIALLTDIGLSKGFNPYLSNNAMWGIIGVPTVIIAMKFGYNCAKNLIENKEKKGMVLERLKELDEEEKEKELDKVKTITNNTIQKAKSNNEMDIDKILNDMLFELEKTNDSDNKEVSYSLDETKDKTLKKTRK